jgi:glycosyltransferase involved in cell wall biosynthesis
VQSEKDKPTVSIFLTTYNRCDLLQEAITSIQAQTFTDFELIICDDASTDGTEQYCKEVAKQDERIRIIRNSENKGMVPNAILGLSACRGEYILRFDDDNRLSPFLLERSMDFFRENPKVAYVFSNEWIINSKGERQDEWTKALTHRFRRDVLKPGVHVNSEWIAAYQSVGCNTAVIRAEVFATVGGFTSTLSAGLDCDLFLKIARLNLPVGFIAEYLCEYRIHEGMSTKDRIFNVTKAREMVSIWENIQFSDEAERQRKRQLTTAYCTLARTLAINGKTDEARQVMRKNLKTNSGNLRVLLIAFVVHLPVPLLCFLIKMRYNVAPSQSTVSLFLLFAFCVQGFGRTAEI